MSVTTVASVFVPIACMQWAIPASDIVDRLNYGMAILLTMIAFKFSIAEMLPKITYVTLLGARPYAARPHALWRPESSLGDGARAHAPPRACA